MIFRRPLAGLAYGPGKVFRRFTHPQLPNCHRYAYILPSSRESMCHLTLRSSKGTDWRRSDGFPRIDSIESSNFKESGQNNGRNSHGGVWLWYQIQYTGHKFFLSFVARVKSRHYFCLVFSHYHIVADISNVLKYLQDKTSYTSVDE